MVGGYSVVWGETDVEWILYPDNLVLRVNIKKGEKIS